MTFALETGVAPVVQRCPDCGGRRTFLGGGLLENEKTVGRCAVYLYRHGHEHEAFLTVSFDDRGIDSAPGAAQRVTFGARFGWVEGAGGPAFSAIDAGEVAGFGEPSDRHLDREAALAHRWIDRFWDACDVLAEDILADHRNWPDGIGTAGVLRRAGARVRHLLHRHG